MNKLFSQLLQFPKPLFSYSNLKDFYIRCVISLVFKRNNNFEKPTKIWVEGETPTCSLPWILGFTPDICSVTGMPVLYRGNCICGNAIPVPIDYTHLDKLNPAPQSCFTCVCSLQNSVTHSKFVLIDDGLALIVREQSQITHLPFLLDHEPGLCFVLFLFFSSTYLHTIPAQLLCLEQISPEEQAEASLFTWQAAPLQEHKIHVGSEKQHLWCCRLHYSLAGFPPALQVNLSGMC